MLQSSQNNKKGFIYPDRNTLFSTKENAIELIDKILNSENSKPTVRSYRKAFGEASEIPSAKGMINFIIGNLKQQGKTEQELKTILNKTNSKGMNLLHYAVTTLDEEAITKLIENGADLNAQDVDNRTPIYLLGCSLVVEKNLNEKDFNIEFWKYLITHGADFKMPGAQYDNHKNFFTTLCEEGNDYSLKILAVLAAHHILDEQNHESLKEIWGEFKHSSSEESDKYQEKMDKFTSLCEEFKKDIMPPSLNILLK